VGRGDCSEVLRKTWTEKLLADRRQDGKAKAGYAVEYELGGLRFILRRPVLTGGPPLQILARSILAGGQFVIILLHVFGDSGADRKSFQKILDSGTAGTFNGRFNRLIARGGNEKHLRYLDNRDFWSENLQAEG
jgi:hypothetical protein